MASITVLDAPDRYSSVYGQVNYLLSSTNANKVGFSYIVDIYTGTSDVQIARLKFPKRPVTGLGLIDVSSVIRPYIDHEMDLSPASTGFTRASNYFKRYSVRWGEQYDYFTFSDSLFYGGNVMFSSYTGDRHDFQVGEKVVIQQTPPFYYSQFEGVHTVTVVPDAFSFVVDVGFQSGPTVGGKAFRNDASPIIFTGVSSGVSVCVGYSFPRDVWTTFNSDDYRPQFGQTEQAMLLTNCPDRYRVRTDDQIFLPQFNNTYCDYLRVITQQEDGQTVGVYEIASPLVGDEAEFVYVGVGPYNLSNSNVNILFGPPDVFGPDVVQYSVAFMSASSTNAMTESRTFVLDSRCEPFRNYRLLFADKMGAWHSMNFYLASSEEHVITKQTFYRGGYGEVIGGSMVYRDQKRGFDVYNTEHLKTYTVRSDELTQDEMDYVKELKSSPRVFWVKSPEVFIPIILHDETWDPLDEEIDYDEPLHVEITFSLAYKENVIN